MTPLAAIILGIVEGATEFIPVSSSGHLIIARTLLGIGEGGLAFDAVLQLATSCALLVYFWKDILRLITAGWNILVGCGDDASERTVVYAIVLGTLPAIVFGLLLEKDMETIFRSVSLVALTLVLGSGLMWYAEYHARRRVLAGVASQPVSVVKGIIIGFFQCLALVPGVSRSGATISGGLFAGLSREEATRFSFLLSIPILFGSGLKKLFDIRHELVSGGLGLPLFLGSVTAFLVGWAAIYFLIRYLKTHTLSVFIWYRVALAAALFLFLR